MNIFTGEKYAYATYFLYMLFLVYKIPLRFSWYDINCRYKAHFRKWVETLQATKPEQHSVLLGLLAVCTTKFPIPPFHKYAHGYAEIGSCTFDNWFLSCACKHLLQQLLLIQPCLPCRAACQKKHNALHMEGIGRGVGEPNEIFNAFVGPKGDTTQYMNPVNRQGALERYFVEYTDKKVAHLPQQLVDWEGRADLQLREAARDMGVHMDSITEHLQLDEEQVRQKLRAFQM